MNCQCRIRFLLHVQYRILKSVSFFQWISIILPVTCYLLPSLVAQRSTRCPYTLLLIELPTPVLYAAAFVRRTTSSTDLHHLLKRSLYLLRFYHIIVYTGCGTFLKRVCHNTRTLLSYLHFYARTYKSIYRLFVLRWSLLLH